MASATLFDAGGGSYTYYRYANVIMIFAFFVALICTIFSLMLITPSKKRKQLPGFFKMLHDIFNFNGLVIEVILKAVYIFMTLYAILSNFFSIFIGGHIFSCLLGMILGPIVIRIMFELMMLLVLLVKNVISINNKLRDQADQKENKTFGLDPRKYMEPTAPQQPVYQQSPYEQPAPAPQQPAPAQKVVCPDCGMELSADSLFCTGCGKNLEG